MIVAACNHESCRKVGRDRKGNQRLRCNLCGKYMLAEKVKPLGDMRISLKAACTAIGMLLEGMSIRAVERLTGLYRDTIDALILHVGDNCQRLLDAKIRWQSEGSTA
jgi:transposase-like protein